MKRLIAVCTICGEESCDGKEYMYPDQIPENRGKGAPDTTCTSQTFVKNGKRYIHIVMGHGCEWDVEVIPKEDYLNGKRAGVTGS
jgi:hypothetical protein